MVSSAISGRRGGPQVLLVSLPFGILNSPSLGLAILQARLKSAGVASRSRYFNLDYAGLIGLDGYARIAGGFPRSTDLLGEWIFSHAVTPSTALERQAYLARTLGLDGDPQTAPAQLARDIQGLAERASDFCDAAAQEIVALRPQVVCFTTVFQQTMASVAVAARVKALDPGIRTVIGGANCEGVMGAELARSYPVFDAVVSGEADLLIVPLIRTLLAGEVLGSPALAAIAERVAGCFVQARMVSDLDSSPRPRFEDYFEDLQRLGERASGLRVQLPLETSRGCWWGAKRHCTFCGLNGSTMAFRSKSSEVALGEIMDFSRRYPGIKVCFVDNIMDHRYFDSLLPKIAEAQLNLDLFYEIKSNVTKDQVRILKAAGVSHIQPGIESLSDQVLGLMRKGVRTIQNLQLLKWCAELNVEVDWNILWGFPGEDPDEYQRQARLVPQISHLQPPARGSRIRLDRFSPNFTSAAELGFSNLRPYPAYQDVYRDRPPESVFDLAYFFEADSPGTAEVEVYTRALGQALQDWISRHGASRLMHLGEEGALVILDSRRGGETAETHVLEDLAARLYRFCDSSRSLAAIARAFPEASDDRLAGLLHELCVKTLMWTDGERYLSLALSMSEFLAAREGEVLAEAMGDVLGAAPPSRAPARPRSTRHSP